MSGESAGAGRRVAVLGAGMHPWGKWGRNFIEYGVTAARAALEEVDPDGEVATPVVRTVPANNAARVTMAVVPDQFEHIALFPGGGPSDEVWKRLAAPDVQPISLTASRVAKLSQPSRIRPAPASSASALPASSRSGTATASTCGLIRRAASAATSAFSAPMSASVKSGWRWRFDSSIRSWSTIVSLPTPAAAR